MKCNAKNIKIRNFHKTEDNFFKSIFKKKKEEMKLQYYFNPRLVLLLNYINSIDYSL